VATVYEQLKMKVSLRGFMRVVGRPYWQLRDYLRTAARRQQRQCSPEALQPAVRQAALRHPTYGYRRLYHALKGGGVRIGRERVRRWLAVLGLKHPWQRKKRRTAPASAAMPALPEGRRAQIDATRVSLADGIAWVYVGEDGASRVCLAASVGRRLSKERAAHTLQAGHQLLQKYGIATPLVIQRDSGSDFTSESCQRCCQTLGQWVRGRVHQIGGLGILERLNRTCKYEFIVRHDVATSAELKGLVTQFQHWYNQERLHSTRGYQVPWQCFLANAALLT